MRLPPPFSRRRFALPCLPCPALPALPCPPACPALPACLPFKSLAASQRPLLPRFTFSVQAAQLSFLAEVVETLGVGGAVDALERVRLGSEPVTEATELVSGRDDGW